MRTLHTRRPDRGRLFLILTGIALVALLFAGGASGVMSAEPGRQPVLNLSVSGDLAVVGAEWEDDFRGAAYVLRREGAGWTVEQRLSPADLERFDHFGAAVAVDGDYVVVGATWKDLFRGAVYVFRRVDGTWVEQDRLVPADAIPDLHFGSSVTIADGIVAIGDRPGGGQRGEGTYRFELTDGVWRERRGSVPAPPQKDPVDVAAGAEVAAVIEDIAQPRPALPQTIPPAPASVEATDGTLETSVDIVWSDVGLDAIVYKVLRDGVLLSVVSSNETRYSDLTAEPGIVYDYCVVVKDMAGQESAPVCDTGSRVIFPPAAVGASDGEYTDRVKVTWVDISAINTGYAISRNGTTIGTVGANASLFNDTTAQPETTYTYDVAAFIGDGHQSLPDSDDGWRGVLLPPQNVSASDGQYLDVIRITWNAQEPDTLSFLVYRDDVLMATVDPGTHTWDDSTVVFGDSHTYCVATERQDVVTGILWSSPQDPRPLGVESIRVCDDGRTGLEAPGNVAASDSTYDDKVRITWDDLSGFEDGYEITRSDVAQLDTLVLATTRANATSYDDFTADPDSTYLYSVRAISSLGGASLYGSDTGYRSVVLAPTEVKATDGKFEDRTEVSWKSASTTAVLFKIYRDGTFIKSVSSADRLYRDYGGTAGQAYDYSVAAVTALEAEAMGMPDPGRRELAPPSDVRASDEEFEDRVIVWWSDNSRLEHGYVVSRTDTGASVPDTSFTVGPNRGSFTDYSAAPGSTYTYSVAAFDTISGAMGKSAPDEDAGRRILVAPTNVLAEKGLYEDRIGITWEDNSDAEDGYHVFRNTQLVGSVGDNETSFTDMMPPAGQTHLYEVRAFDAFGESAAASDSGYATLYPPASVNASDTYDDRVEITWIDQSQVEEGYEVLRDGEVIATLTPPYPPAYTDTHGPLRLEGSRATGDYAWGVSYYNNYALVADGTAGLQVIDVATPGNPIIVGSHDSPGYARGCVWAGVPNVVFLADGPAGLRVISIEFPENPIYLGSADTPGEAFNIAVQNHTVLVADGSAGLQALDVTVSGPVSVVISPLGGVDTPGEARDVAITGSYAFVADADSGVQVIDFTNPYSPVIVAGYDTPGSATGIALAGNYAFVADSLGLEIVDVTDPSNPTFAGRVATPGDASGVTVSGDLAYVADDLAGIHEISIADPENPILNASYDTPGSASAVALQDGYVFVAQGSAGLGVLSTLLDPQLIYSYCVRSFTSVGTSPDVCDNGMVTLGGAAILSTQLYEKHAPADLNTGGGFGNALDLNGDRMIVGTYRDDDMGWYAGAAYVYRWDGSQWAEEQKLTASDGADDNAFGTRVSIEGARVLVGAPRSSAPALRSGSAYYYEWNGTSWVQQQKLTASDGDVSAGFGQGVALEGDWAIVGAYGDDEQGYPAGAAYVFNWNGTQWTETQKLLASDGTAYRRFGWDIAIAGGVAVIGTQSGGAAYIFERSGITWAETQKLTPTISTPIQFGQAVSMSGNLVIVAGDSYESIGAAYVFEKLGGTWVETKLTVPEVRAGDRFGFDADISGNYAIVSSFDRAAYTFRLLNGTWTPQEKLTPFDGSGGNFGYSVAIDSDQLAVGRPYVANLGAVYVSERVPEPGDVVATDGTLESRVHVTWADPSPSEKGFRVYRDGEPIATVDANVEVYEDFDAEPGRIYQYGVATLADDLGNESGSVTDFGWRPANGNITGHVSTSSGLASVGVSMVTTPLPTRALQFDGKGGYVSVADTAGTLGFDNASSYTVELWVRYAGDGGEGAADGVIVSRSRAEGGVSRYPYELGNMRSTGAPGRLRFTISDGGTTVTVGTSSTGLNDNMWHHVACVHDAAVDSMRVYVDGVLEGSASSAGIGDITNAEPVSLGVGRETGSWFGGQVDEVRIWNSVRDIADIASSMTTPLVGDETGLVGYWPVGWPNGYRVASPGAITDAKDGAHYGAFHGGVYQTDDCVPLEIQAKTDSNGNFVINSLYYGTEAEFEVRPVFETHEFDPPVKRVSLTTESPVENQVDFTDISTFTVFGTVRYRGTACAVGEVPILVDSRPAGGTDKNGKFEVEVPHGEHSIRPSLEGHVFEPDSLLLLINEDVSLNDSSGVAFRDTTARTLSGRVGGGCGRPVGDVTISITSENDCLLQELTVLSGDSAYSVVLPPQSYLVSASVDPATIPDGLVKTDVVRFFQNLGIRMAEMDSTDVEMDFVYRAPLQVAITGLDPYRETCPGPLTFETRTLPDDLPVIAQLDTLRISVEVNEDYGSGGLCPLDSGTVTIYDEFFDRANQPFELEVRDGVAVCTTFVSTPSLIVGRVDADGNDRSFQKSFGAVVNVEGRAPVTATEWALVTGHVAPEGADFVTGTFDLPLYILRDPPGDGSYAWLEEGEQIRTTVRWDDYIYSNAGGINVSIEPGVRVSWFVGFGAGTIFELEIKPQFKTSWMWGTTVHSERKTDITCTLTERFSTSPEDLFVGGQGDVFIGAGYNFIFSEVGVLAVDGCAITRSTSLGFEPDSISTVYAYTEQYIEQGLIPELDAKSAYYEALQEPDSAAAFRVKADRWREILAENASLKAAAETGENRSFSAGADFSSTKTAETTEWYHWSETATTDGDIHIESLDLHFNYVDIEISGDYKHHSEYLKRFVDRDETVTQTIGYTLSDDDIGDHFTVDIKSDGRYPSPVFDALAGVSSCPYEAWPEPETGQARLLPRDKPGISAVAVDNVDVPPDEPAVFILNLFNQSPTGESRLYALRLLTESNPYGAIVKVGGVPLSTGSLQYFIEAGQSQQATLTVERGPTRYGYDNLELMLYAPCEYALWENGGPLQQVATCTVSASFDAPCSDVTLVFPEPGWAFTKADEDAGSRVYVLLSDYELTVSETDSLEEVGIEYRRLGHDSEGPSPWTAVTAGAPGAVETEILWQPHDSLSDGVYEVRAYTRCPGGYGYSVASTGTIERHGPMVLGSPQPADGELSLGEDISITFNELIDCRSIDPDSVGLYYLDGSTPGAGIPIGTVCDGRTIVVRPETDMNALEGRHLEARVRGIRDRAGNPLEVPAIWDFYYRQSRFTWSELLVSRDVPYRDPGVVTAQLVNGTGAAVDYTITQWPSAWIDGVSPTVGSIAPGASSSVVFAIRNDLAGGVYQGEVVAEAADSTQGVAVFDLRIAVSCHEPMWAVDPSRFEHSMTMVARLDIGGQISTDVNDRVAAFVGGRLRGEANLTYVLPKDSSYAFLTVYSNRAQGETVRFQVWDADDCRLYNATLEDYPFVANAVVGSPDAPVTLTATDVTGDSTLAIPVSEGWTWISTNVSSYDMSVSAVLSDLLPEPGDVIKSQVAFSQFVDDSTGWSGGLVDLDNVSSYMLKLSAPGTILHTGDTLNPAVPVQQGWNWIGYLPRGPIDVSTALADLVGLVSTGDVIKSQAAFAEYVGGAWYGSLEWMEPGQGYKLFLASSPDSSFVYPVAGSVAAVVAASGGGTDRTAADTSPAWAVDPHAYQYNMTVTSVLRVQGRESIDENDVVAAFVGDECRGIARPVYVEGIGRHELFLLVCSNEVAGETVTMRAFDADAGVTYDVTETLAFESDRVAGTVLDPLVLRADEQHAQKQTVPGVFALEQNYPNPFNPQTVIRYDVPPGGGRVTLRVYDAAGRLVRSLVDRVETPGRKSVIWRGVNNRGQQVATGVYFCRMTAPGFEKTRKMVLLK